MENRGLFLMDSLTILDYLKFSVFSSFCNNDFSATTPVVLFTDICYARRLPFLHRTSKASKELRRQAAQYHPPPNQRSSYSDLELVKSYIKDLTQTNTKGCKYESITLLIFTKYHIPVVGFDELHSLRSIYHPSWVAGY